MQIAHTVDRMSKARQVDGHVEVIRGGAWTPAKVWWPLTKGIPTQNPSPWADGTQSPRRCSTEDDESVQYDRPKRSRVDRVADSLSAKLYPRKTSAHSQLTKPTLRLATTSCSTTSTTNPIQAQLKGTVLWFTIIIIETATESYPRLLPLLIP